MKINDFWLPGAARRGPREVPGESRGRPEGSRLTRGLLGAVLIDFVAVLEPSGAGLGAILAGPRGHETPSGVTSRGGEPMEGVPGGSWGALEASCTKTFGILKIIQKPIENQ